MSGPTLTEERKAELGWERLALRPVRGTKRDLKKLQRRWGCNSLHEVVTRLAREAVEHGV